MLSILFAVVCLAFLWLIGCALWSIRHPERRLWPPGENRGVAFRVSSVFGPGINFGLIGLAVFGRGTLGVEPWLGLPVGGVLLLLGVYFGLGGYFFLGGQQTMGQEGELIDSGPYRYSRNPQYVGAVLGFLGLALLFDSAPGLAASALGTVWFVLLPFAEEPWLRDKLGAPYEAYAARVPRFLGPRAKD